MTKIKIKSRDIMQRGHAELVTDLSDIREKLLNSRMKHSESRNKNVKEARELRKNVARILTVLNKK